MNIFAGYRVRRALSRHAGTIALNVLALAAVSIVMPAQAADYYGYGAPRYGATTYAPQPRYVEPYAPVEFGAGLSPCAARNSRSRRHGSAGRIVIRSPDSKPAARLRRDAVSAGRLWCDTISSGRMGDDAVSAGRLWRDTISSGRMGDDAVSTGRIWRDAVSTGRLWRADVSAGQVRPSLRPGRRSKLSSGPDAARLRAAGRSRADHHATSRSAL